MSKTSCPACNRFGLHKLALKDGMAKYYCQNGNCRVDHYYTKKPLELEQ